jgi:hypothetical protein
MLNQRITDDHTGQRIGVAGRKVLNFGAFLELKVAT